MAEETGGPGIIQRIIMVLDRMSAQKTAADMQETLDKGADPKKANAHMERMIGMAKKLGAALAAAFAVTKLIQFGREAVNAAMEARRSWGLLAQQIENAGVSFDKVEARTRAVAQSFIDAGIAGDEAFADALRTLVAISGDYEKSLMNMTVVADVAAGKQIGLEEAATLVAKAMNGNVSALQKLGIEVPKGADAVQFLAERFRGMSEAIDPATRAQTRLREEWGEFKEAVGEALIASGNGVSVLGTLTAVVKAMSGVVEDNREAIATLGRIVSWFVRLPGAMILGLFSGLITVVSAAAKTYWMFAEAASFVGRLFGANTEGIDKHIQGLEDWIVKADEAAKAADKLARALMGQGPATPGTKPLDRTAPIGGAIRGAKGTEPAGEKPKTEEELLRERIRVATDAIGFESTRSEGLAELIALEEELRQKMAEGNLTLEERVALNQAYQDVTDALKEGIYQVAEAAGVSREAVDMFFSGQAKAALGEIAKEAKGRALWNAAKALEELARAFGAKAVGNFPGAAAHMAAFKTHLASAAKWGLAGAGVGAIAGGGGGATGGGSENLGGDAAARSQGAGVQVTVWVDGVDPDNPVHQERINDANRQIRERYGEDSVITVGAAR